MFFHRYYLYGHVHPAVYAIVKQLITSTITKSRHTQTMEDYTFKREPIQLEEVSLDLVRELFGWKHSACNHFYEVVKMIVDYVLVRLILSYSRRIIMKNFNIVCLLYFVEERPSKPTSRRKSHPLAQTPGSVSY